jgi:hypothetical protein
MLATLVTFGGDIGDIRRRHIAAGDILSRDILSH